MRDQRHKSQLKKNLLSFGVLVLASIILVAPQRPALGADGQAEKPIVLKTMGSLFFGGTVNQLENGETFHGDHGYAQYYIPQNSRNYPIVMWHGIGQSGRSFESTPDGREGYQAILTRNDWPVYIMDQARRGRAGRTMAPAAQNNIPTTMQESGVWDAFRMGTWLPPEKAEFYPNTQSARTGYTIDQFMRQQTGDTGELPRTRAHSDLMATNAKKLFEQTGPGILLTHSYSGQFGWYTGMAAPELIKAIVAYEPGQHVLPEGEEVEEIISPLQVINERLKPQRVPLEEFKKLTRMPIILIYGDNIRTAPGKTFNEEVWRVALEHAKQFVGAINRHGGDATLLHLPSIGIKGNTHAAFADLNNREIAGLLEKWLAEKKLDGRDKPHQGPKRPELPISIPLKDSDAK